MVKKASQSARNSKRASGAGAPAKESRGGSVCAVSGACGGCSQVEQPYEEQLAAKDALVARLFSDEAFAGASIGPTLGMQAPFHYRNKVTSPFAPGRRTADGRERILSGMYAAGSHRIVPTDACLLENEQAQQVVRAVKSLMGKFGIAPYDEDSGRGFMRHAVVRVGHESGEVLVTLVTNSREFPKSKSFCRQLVSRCPFITTVVQNVNTRQTNVILGDREQRLYGPGFILDTLCGLSFRISSQSFYQVNSAQTTVLYEQAMQLAGLRTAPGQGLPGMHEPLPDSRTPHDACALPGVVIDAYCGTGTIGLVAASRGAGQVIGVDSVESAIRDARANAQHNGIGNARFVAADATEFMQQLAGQGKAADVVIMDPPRAGSTREFLDALVALAPSRVVYVSCNPRTQVRDALHLAGGGYRLRTVQPVDMFPHTGHIETVALFERGPVASA